jgi:hypothetical protein
MSRKTHPAVLVIAILHFLFGVIGLCGFTAGAAQVSGLVPQFSGAPQGKGAEKIERVQKRLQEALEQAPGQKVLQLVSLGVSFTLSVILIIGGIGLLQMRSWARWLSVVYAVVDLVYLAATVVFYFVVTQPALEGVRQELENIDPGMAQLFQLAFTVGSVLGPLITLIYPTTVLIIMLLPGVGRAFHAIPPEAKAGEEYRPDYYDDRYER